MKKTHLAVATSLGAILVVAAVHGRADARVDRLAARVDSLAFSLGEVITVVEGSTAGPPRNDSVEVTTDGMTRGRDDAPVTMVEFLDYECPFCQRFHAETLPILLKEYVDTGKLRIVVRDRPLPMHENAREAARAARCAAEQDEAAHLVFADSLATAGAPLDHERIAAVASATGMDEAALTECMATDRHDDAIEADVAAATEAGVTGTPTFIVGPSDSGGSIRGRVIRGAYPIETFRSAIEDALVAASAGPES